MSMDSDLLRALLVMTYRPQTQLQSIDFQKDFEPLQVFVHALAKQVQDAGVDGTINVLYVLQTRQPGDQFHYVRRPITCAPDLITLARHFQPGDQWQIARRCDVLVLRVVATRVARSDHNVATFHDHNGGHPRKRRVASTIARQQCAHKGIHRHRREEARDAGKQVQRKIVQTKETLFVDLALIAQLADGT